MHVSGLLGMPRRIYTYPSGMGWDTSNLLTTIGSFVFGIGIVMFVINALVSARRGARAGDNPWGAPGLEWSVASPTPAYNFAVLPLIASRHPLWETRGEPRRSSLRVGYRLADGREALAVSPLAATPSAILKMPEDTCVPFVLSLLATAVFAAMLVRSPTLVGVAALGCAIALGAWLWPRRSLGQRAPAPSATACRRPRRSRCTSRPLPLHRRPRPRRMARRCRSAAAANARAAGGVC